MDELLALGGDQDESTGLSELLEIVDEWLGGSQGASGRAMARHAVPTTAQASSALPIVCSESVSAVSEPIEAALPISAAPWPSVDKDSSDALGTTAKWMPVSGSKRPRERNTAVDMLRRLKKKVEHSLLRVEVRDLKFQLAALQQSRCDGSSSASERTLYPASSSGSTDSLGNENAVDKHRQTQMQEVLRQVVIVNRQLRARVIKNDALLRSIRNAIRSSRMSDNEEQLLSEVCAHHSSAVNGSPAGYGADAEQTAPLEAVHVDADYVLRKLPPLTADCLVCSSEITVDAFGSPRFEIKTVTTLGCNIQAFSPLFAEKFRKTSTLACMVLKCLKTKVRVCEHSYSREVRYLGSTLLMHSSDVVYKDDQEDGSIVFTWSSRMSHPDGAIGFRGYSWIIVMRSPQSPSEMTTIRTLYELTPERISPSVVSIDGESPEKVRACLFRVLSERVRLKHTHLQHKLLVETGRGEHAAVLGA